MTDFGKYSPFEPPADREERERWLLANEERIARRTRRALVKAVDASTERFLNTLTAAGDMSVFDNIPQEWMLYVDEYLIDELQGMYLSGGLTSWITTRAGERLPEQVAMRWIDVVNQNAADYALIARNRMEDVGLTAWNTIKDKVSTAILEGRSIEDLKGLIETNRRFSEFRADTIARTETLNAYNNGDFEGAEALGEFGPTHKYWIATGDARAREWHTELDGTVLLMDEAFDVDGEPMMYPHDPSASAMNVVNCRCSIGFLYPGDEDPLTGDVIEAPEGWTDPFEAGVEATFDFDEFAE